MQAAARISDSRHAGRHDSVSDVRARREPEAVQRGIAAAREFWARIKQISEYECTVAELKLKHAQILHKELGDKYVTRAEVRILRNRLRLLREDLAETEREIDRLAGEWFESAKGS